ncbi:spore coat protein [Melghirimyces algeriensis]|uniref:Coat F domain-containing protein n=1 Tax=Melghirimyces algeriensis TaxID=910412 RepID=A0A521CK13_9BACL|nr:spore coat protein [Melghirimyces algeriensis]SMO59764.1 Coat F domain-containing protein [Melghirimyces algeriensis]
MELLEREMARDMLMTERQLAQCFLQTEMGCSNQDLREGLHPMQMETKELHHRLSNTMQQKGWLQTSVAGQQEIESLILHWEQQALKQPTLGEGKQKQH